MAIEMGFPKPNYGWKRNFRYILSIPDVCGIYPQDGMYCKLHDKVGRPNISYKEMTVEHIGQTISFPGKVVFEAVNITLWDTYKNGNEGTKNPVWQWLNGWYNFYEGKYKSPSQGFKKNCVLKLYDGCGCEIERWNYENAYPASVNFGELSMSDSAVCTIDISMKYDRAYII